MHHTSLAVFLALMVAFSGLWGRSLYYAAERSSLIRVCTFALIAHTRRPAQMIKSGLLTVVYLLGGAVGICAFAFGYGLDLRVVFGIPKDALFLIMLGIFAELSLSSLFMMLLFALTRWRVNPVQIISEVPWIAGINALPPSVRPLVPGLSGFVEESFFRGIVLLILVRRFHVAPAVAIAVVALCFTLEQMIQTRSLVQAAIIATGCLAISVVGGVLVVLTGSVFAAGLCHASFVVFYFRRIEPAPASIRA
jgi:hypothetical protein